MQGYVRWSQLCDTDRQELLSWGSNAPPQAAIAADACIFRASWVDRRGRKRSPSYLAGYAL